MPPKAKQRATKASSNPSKQPIPPPFSPAPAALEPLLSTFDRTSVYVIHIDTHPAWFKRRIFSVPVILNLSIVLLLIWRAYYLAPHYWAILMSVLGHLNSTTIIYDEASRWLVVWKVVKRMAMFMGDFVLFRFVAPWGWSFFIEQPGNPVSWRWNVGFRDEEVYVRVSRGWGAQDLLGETEGATGKKGAESPFFHTRILPAVEKKRLKEKTGYLLMDDSFDLDFFGMVAATELLDRKLVGVELLRKSVFVFLADKEGEGGQWLVWDCAKLDKGDETEARDKVLKFKERLTAIGKESLFFRWVELIQYESNAPGGFTEERQAAAAEKVKKLFEDNGVDFEEFSQEIGGMDGMTGM